MEKYFAVCPTQRQLGAALSLASALWLAQPSVVQAKPAQPPKNDTAAALGLSQPHPNLSPKQVVAIQLKALQQVDVPEYNAGIATVYRFASPENRSQTGPLQRFTEMLRTGYPEMLGHRSHVIDTGLQQGETLLLPVEVTTRAGRVLRYVFILRQQTAGALKGCWMTDGVVLPDEQADAQEA